MFFFIHVNESYVTTCVTHEWVTNKLRHDPAKTQPTDQMSMASQCTQIMYMYICITHTNQSQTNYVTTQQRRSRPTKCRWPLSVLQFMYMYICTTHKWVTNTFSHEQAKTQSTDQMSTASQNTQVMYMYICITHKSVTNTLRYEPAKMQPTDQMSMASVYFLRYSSSGARYHLSICVWHQIFKDPQRALYIRWKALHIRKRDLYIHKRAEHLRYISGTTCQYAYDIKFLRTLMCDVTHYVTWQDSLKYMICVTWLILSICAWHFFDKKGGHMCDMSSWV